MSWKPEVFVEGKWAGNGLAFATKEESDAYGRALLGRWFVPTDSRSVESDEPVNYVLLVNGQIHRVEEAETPAEELGRLRRELSELGPDTPEHRDTLDRIAVLVRETAEARR